MLNVQQGAGANPAAAQAGAVAGAPQAAATSIANQGGDVSGLDFGMGSHG
jgi:hypothetical protein